MNSAERYRRTLLYLQVQHTGTVKKVLQCHLKAGSQLRVSDGLETVMKHPPVLFGPRR
jgi:hypothetical protein